MHTAALEDATAGQHMASGDGSTEGVLFGSRCVYEDMTLPGVVSDSGAGSLLMCSPCPSQFSSMFHRF